MNQEPKVERPSAEIIPFPIDRIKRVIIIKKENEREAQDQPPKSA
jgi:hypothetical protein